MNKEANSHCTLTVYINQPTYTVHMYASASCHSSILNMFAIAFFVGFNQKGKQSEVILLLFVRTKLAFWLLKKKNEGTKLTKFELKFKFWLKVNTFDEKSDKKF